MSATGEYRLRKQADGLGHFAHILVEASYGGGEPAIRWDVSPTDRGSAQPQYDPDLVEAAIAGVTDAYAALTRAGFDVEGWVVHIKRAIVDSNPPAVRVAAAAATVDAFGFGAAFEVTYQNGWRFGRRSS